MWPLISLFYARKVKVKCILAQALRFCTGRTVHKGSRGIALLFLDHGTRRGEGSASRPGRSLPPGKTRDPVPILQEAGWAPGPVWTVAENLASTVIRSPARPARSQSLYRLRYPAHFYVHTAALFMGAKLGIIQNTIYRTGICRIGE